MPRDTQDAARSGRRYRAPRGCAKQVSGTANATASTVMAFGVINNVRKVFQLEEIGWSALEPIVALDDASFRFEEGELVALLGPSGCGKTTLLRIIGGLISKTAGGGPGRGSRAPPPTGGPRLCFLTPTCVPPSQHPPLYFFS